MPVAQHTQEIHANAVAPGSSQVVATSVASAATTPLAATSALVTVTVGTFVRFGNSAGATPTAAADGTDMYLAPNIPYRLSITSGSRLAFILGAATGSAYVTPGA